MHIASLGKARRQGGSSITFVQEGTKTFREGFETFSTKVPKPCPKVSKPLVRISILPNRCDCVQLVELEVSVWAENLHASMKHD
ncbi:hypothetical protein GQ457_07G003940 [Hibiscus cannabinus]